MFRLSYCIRSKCTSDKYFLYKWSTRLQRMYNHMVRRTASVISLPSIPYSLLSIQQCLALQYIKSMVPECVNLKLLLTLKVNEKTIHNDKSQATTSKNKCKNYKNMSCFILDLQEFLFSVPLSIKLILVFLRKLFNLKVQVLYFEKLSNTCVIVRIYTKVVNLLNRVFNNFEIKPSHFIFESLHLCNLM